MIDFKKVKPPKVADKPPDVSDEIVLEVANGMADLGYRASADSIAALTEILSGRAVMLIGNCGTGKSLFFKVLSDYTSGVTRMYGKPNHPYKFAVVRANLASVEPVERLLSFLDWHQNWPLVLDDLCTENTASDYGRRFEVADIVMHKREFSNQHTHVITNCSERELLKRYGDRTLDRFHHADPIVFHGNSARLGSAKIPLTNSEWYHVFGEWKAQTEE